MATKIRNLNGEPKWRRSGIATARRRTAAGETSAGRMGGASVFAWAAGLVLLLETIPQHAEAKACQSKKVELGPGCVIADDIKQDDLTAVDRKDEAGQSFDARKGAKRIDFFISQFGDPTIFASAKSAIPAGGVVIVTASAVIDAKTPDTYGAVRCDLIASDGVAEKRTNGVLFGSVDARDGLTTDTMAYMTGLAPAQKGVFTFDLACGLAQGQGVATNADEFGKGVIKLRASSLTVQYFSTRY